MIRSPRKRSAPAPHVVSAFRNTTVLGASMIGFTSGIAGLVSGGREGPTVLAGLAVICAGYLVVAIAAPWVFGRRRRLVTELELARQELTEYRAAVEAERERYARALIRLVDRQSMLYSEELEITVIIGEDASEDRVIERRVTTPTPILLSQSMRPILRMDVPNPPRFDELELSVDVEDSRGVNASPLLLTQSGPFVRTLIIFDPMLTRTLAWTMSYRSPGLWDHLRARAEDTLAWDARTPSGRRSDCTLSRFAVRFVFPSNAWGAIYANADRGKISEAKDSAGRLVLEWLETAPEGLRYEWDLSFQAAPGAVTGT